MSDDNSNSSFPDEFFQIPISFYMDLTDGGKQYFNHAVYEYAEKLNQEARNIEHIEHTGEGNAEITAAHIQEARWVLIRRLRHSNKLMKKIIVFRVFQIVGTAGIGVGGSYFTKTLGSVGCIGGVVLVALMLILEIVYTRES